jgi:hypothetical protein
VRLLGWRREDEDNRCRRRKGIGRTCSERCRWEKNTRKM